MADAVTDVAVGDDAALGDKAEGGDGGLEAEQGADVVTDMAPVAVEPVLTEMTPTDAPADAPTKAPAADTALVKKAAGGEDEPLILMAKRRSFAVEGQGCAVIVVNRLGGAAARGLLCEVDFTTGSAAGHKAGAGTDFTALTSTLCFGPGVSEMRIRVPLISDSRYEPMERFIVKLTAARGASLGPVTETLVHIVDDDHYPANLPADASEWQLLYAFYRERWRHRWPKPLKSLLYDMYESFHELIGTYIPLVCAAPQVRSSPLWLALVGAVFLISAAFNWHCSYHFQNHRGNSGTRKDWRNWLVNRFVWLSEERHLQVDPMRWFHTISNDVDEAVKKCWHEHYILINAAVDVVLQIVVAAAVLGWLASVPLAFIIPALVIMINVSWRPLIEKLDKRFSAEDTWMHYVMDHACNWLLVQTHEMRDQSSMEFEKKNTKFYKDHRTARFLELNMEEALKMASNVGLAAILVIGAVLIERNALSIAAYITLVKVYQRVGKKTIDFCKSGIKITRGLSALRRVIDAINLPLGIGHMMDPWPDANDLASFDDPKSHQGSSPKMKIGRIMDSAAAANPTLSPLRRRSLMDSGGKVSLAKVEPASDFSKADAVRPIPPSGDSHVSELTKIRLQDVHFSYALDKDVAVLRGVTAEFPLGSLYLLKAMGGADTEDKLSEQVVSSTLSTLLKLCSGQLAPTSGTVHTPGYLRVRFVPQEPLIFGTSLMNNLVPTTTTLTEEQIWALAHVLGLSDHLVGQPDYPLGTGGLGIKLVDRQVVCLMRAMLCDPDVLLLCKPAALMKPAHAAKIYRALGQWVDGGGLDGISGVMRGTTPGETHSSSSDEERVRRIAKRSLRTIICSTDESMHEIEPSHLSFVPKVVALPIGQGTGKSNWRKLRSAWKLSSIRNLKGQGHS